MSSTPLCIALAVALSAPAAPLAAQAAMVRPTVARELTSYVPTSEPKATLEVPGTDALADLGDEWARVFARYQPGIKLVYLPKLTREAVKDLTEGARPMIITARELTPDEMKGFQAKFGYLPMRIPVCLDAIIVFVHKNNPLKSISLEQLDAIYSKDRLGGATAAVVTWGDLKVKGPLAERPVTAYARAEGVATRDGFQSTVLRHGEFRAGIQVRPDAPALAEAVVTDETAIAFGSLASWYAGVKVLPVTPYLAKDARFPDQANVTSSRYPMPQLYYAYVNRTPGKPLNPEVSEFLRFILSQEGQGAAADVGILPAPAEFLTIALKRIER